MTTRDLTIHNTLLSLPLFQGMTKGELNEVIAKAKFDFEKHPKGKTIIEPEQTCRGFKFLISGEIASEKSDTEKKFIFRETHSAPYLIQPEVCFGLHQRYTRKFTAISKASLVTFNKNDVLERFLDFTVFRMNLLNILSQKAQYNARLLDKPHKSDTKESIKLFFLTNSLHPAGEKTLITRMEDFADHLLTTRSKVSKALNDLSDEGLIVLKRKEIIVPSLEKLLTI
ncbi:MAG: Crp/Fnr family transcriptional regulator [Bacteroidaceae bacterium]|nr:Crp/Fnr family transcriptional regulator [Bacteroidaceae bacterium]